MTSILKVNRRVASLPIDNQLRDLENQLCMLLYGTTLVSSLGHTSQILKNRPQRIDVYLPECPKGYVWTNAPTHSSNSQMGWNSVDRTNVKYRYFANLIHHADANGILILLK